MCAHLPLVSPGSTVEIRPQTVLLLERTLRWGKGRVGRSGGGQHCNNLGAPALL